MSNLIACANHADVLCVLQCADLYVDLETLKGEIELDNDKDGDEQDKLYNELASVQSSLKRLRDQNSMLSKQISDEKKEVTQ